VTNQQQAADSPALHAGAGQPGPASALAVPGGRRTSRPDRAAHALGALALEVRCAPATGRFYKRDKPATPPRSSQDTGAQQRLWIECQRLLGIA